MNKSAEFARNVKLSDYQPPQFIIDSVDLTFNLGEDHTLVTSRLTMRSVGGGSLVLNGENLELISIALDGRKLNQEQYRISSTSLTVLATPADFVLEICTRIYPEKNIALEGLYKSSGNFCTQCEAEGFRKITYYLDRPDVMAQFTTKIIANKKRYPVLLSNGNLIEQGESADGDHFAIWNDPFKKPAYLFALVAGNLACVENIFITKSKRRVALKFYVEHGNENSCGHAITSLQRAMKWDEEVFGLEYDLDIYMVVAVSDFNMGAMENKGLNIFNTKYVLADPKVATDADLQGIERVIGHEYFHNWTGNRVTCRDWFQLSLKEGLTVFRDQEFSSDMSSRAVKRIDDVRVLRAAQFSEDKGPLAHPVRPDSYQSINNFYTATIYNKGAEVIRMMHTLLGAEGFRLGMDLYFKRHDGQAVTCDDFAQAMQDANQADFSQLKLWYSQAGTPVLDIEGFFDRESQTFSLSVSQSCPATPGQATKEPFHIPLSVALISKDGHELEGTRRILNIKHSREMFIFGGIEDRPVPSLLRGFSAPVILNYEYSDADLLHLVKFDTDLFNRWEAGQRVATGILLRLIEGIQQEKSYKIPPKFVAALRELLLDEHTDPELVALALVLPSEAFVSDKMLIVDVDAIHAARQFLKLHIARKLRVEFETVYQQQANLESTKQSGTKNRALKNLCLSYLSMLGEVKYLDLCETQFSDKNNMTNRIAALACLVEHDSPQTTKALATYSDEFSANALAMDKWFAVQAQSSRLDTLEQIKSLEKNRAFSITNPNKVRSLIGAFCSGNMVNFHSLSGLGYQFLADRVIQIDTFNPQIAARMVSPLCDWRRFDDKRQQLMKTALRKIFSISGLSANTSEIVGKSLADAG